MGASSGALLRSMSTWITSEGMVRTFPSSTSPLNPSMEIQSPSLRVTSPAVTVRAS